MSAEPRTTTPAKPNPARTNGNGNQPAQQQQGQSTAVSVGDEFRRDIALRTAAIKAALPAHIPVEKFQSAALMAFQANPDLANADRQSVHNALIRCAGDGLLPDNREATVQIYNTKVGSKWVKKAQYMPMVYGVIKRMRNSGEVSTIEAHIVHKNDKFTFQLGDDPKLEHTPILDGDPGEAVLAYCVVNFKDGSRYREIMTVAEINKAREQSKSYKDKDGKVNTNSPWVKWWDEMAKKTVIHRAAKRLPSSASLDKFMRQDMTIMLNPDAIEKEDNAKIPPKATSAVADNFADIEGEAQVIDNGQKSNPEAEGDQPPQDENLEGTDGSTCHSCNDTGLVDDGRGGAMDCPDCSTPQ